MDEPVSEEPERFSHFDEERIIGELVAGLDAPRYCIDIGASDGRTMSNSLRLFREGFTGLAAEADPARFARLADEHAGRPSVELFRGVVTPAGAVGLLQAAGCPPDPAFLTIDIDGYDYFVLEAVLSSYRPQLICAEINEKIPPPVRFTVLFSEDYAWDETHFRGMSIAQLDRLRARHDYAFVALEYNNVFLMPSEIAPRSLTTDETYRTGYAERADRLERMPWNREVEPLQSMTPEEAVDWLHERFRPHAGRYLLEAR